jgi:hypothetical protein
METFNASAYFSFIINDLWHFQCTGCFLAYILIFTVLTDILFQKGNDMKHLMMSVLMIICMSLSAAPFLAADEDGNNLQERENVRERMNEAVEELAEAYAEHHGIPLDEARGIVRERIRKHRNTHRNGREGMREQMRERIRAYAEENGITEEEAVQRIRERMGERGERGDETDREARRERMRERIRAYAEENGITEEEAMQRIRERMGERGERGVHRDRRGRRGNREGGRREVNVF